MTLELVEPSTINDRLQSILDGVVECLAGNTPEGAPADAFISWTRPPDDCCGYVAIWLDRILPTTNFPTTDTTDASNDCAQRPMVRVLLKLVRDCYPTVTPEGTPSPDSMQAAAESLLLDAYIMWCCLAGGHPDEIAGKDGEMGYRVESVIPDAPRGGCAGATATLLLEFDPCC